LPDITVDNPDWNAVVPVEDPVNFLAFTTTANGEPVATQVEQKVFAMGVERTAMLQQLSIPLAPQFKATSNALDALPKEKWDELIAPGVYWPQTFTAGQETVIEHRYKPSVGASAGSEIGGPIYNNDPQFAADQKKRIATYTAKYCMSSSFLAMATKAQQ